VWSGLVWTFGHHDARLRRLTALRRVWHFGAPWQCLADALDFGLSTWERTGVNLALNQIHTTQRHHGVLERVRFLPDLPLVHPRLFSRNHLRRQLAPQPSHRPLLGHPRHRPDVAMSSPLLSTRRLVILVNVPQVGPQGGP
jgi:hypothetical protein